MPWDRIELLSEHCAVDDFECGLASVDDWFREKALEAHAARRVAVHAALTEENALVGFFALRHIIVNLEGESKSTRRGAERDPEDHATAVLLAQMGVDRVYQGNGAGSRLVNAAMQAAVVAHTNAPFSFFVVDAANDELVPYYRNFGFRHHATQPRRLFMTMSAVRRIVGAASRS